MHGGGNMSRLAMDSAMRFTRAVGRTGPVATALTPYRAAAIVAACIPLAACGTDIERLLERDSVLVANADRLAATAEATQPELTTELYDAEDAKRVACEAIYASVAEFMTRPPSFGEELVADIGAFVAYLVPIEEVERCAEAQARYQAAVEALADRVGAPTDSERSDN